MNDERYEIDLDRAARLIVLRPKGIWDLDTLRRYTADVRRAFDMAQDSGIGADRLRVLVDLRQHGVQPREVAQQLQEHLSTGASSASRHAVLMPESMLRRMQAQRVGSGLGNVLFSADAGEVMRWLDGEAGRSTES